MYTHYIICPILHVLYYMPMCVYIYIYREREMYLGMYIYIYIHTYMYMYKHMPIHTHICVMRIQTYQCVYTCMYSKWVPKGF